MVELSKEQSLALSDYLWDVMLCTDHVDLSTELGRLINNTYSQFGALDQMLERAFHDLGDPNPAVLCNAETLDAHRAPHEPAAQYDRRQLASVRVSAPLPRAARLHPPRAPELQSDSACNCLGGKRFQVPLCVPPITLNGEHNALARSSASRPALQAAAKCSTRLSISTPASRSPQCARASTSGL